MLSDEDIHDLMYGRGLPMDTEDAIDFAKAIERAVLAKVSQKVQGEPVQSLDERMKAAGMLSVSQLLAGAPMDAFHKHAGVVDLDSLLEWVEMRRGECLRAQARYDLDKPKDDLYEWAIAHSAVFTELHVNLRAAIEGEKTKASPAPKQEPIYMWRLEGDGWMECTKEWFDAAISAGYEKRIVYAAPPQAAAIPTEQQILSVAKMVMPAAYLAEENYKICSFAYAILSAAPKPEGE